MGSCSEWHMSWGASAEGWSLNQAMEVNMRDCRPRSKLHKDPGMDGDPGSQCSLCCPGLESRGHGKSGCLSQDGNHLLMDAKGFSATSDPLQGFRD